MAGMILKNTNGMKEVQTIVSVHDDKSAIKCQICKKIFSQQGYMKRHIASVHEGKKAYNCELCDYRFSEKGSLKTHMTSVHEGKKESIKM
jgi:uncharacterized Zn-finger protein